MGVGGKAECEWKNICGPPKSQLELEGGRPQKNYLEGIALKENESEKSSEVLECTA